MTREDIASILKQLRTRAGLTQKEAAGRLGRKQQTLASWETGQAQPDANTLFSLCELYGVSVNDAFGFNSVEHLSVEEIDRAKKIRTLDEHGRKIVDAILEIELARVYSEATTDSPIVTSRIRSMQVYTDPSAAGVPLYAESDYEYIDFPEDEIPANADFGVRISGDSMEPTIHDGDIAWIRATAEIDDGRIGVFMLDGGDAVCKRVELKADGRVCALRSDNAKYPPIKGADLNGLRVVGEVLE